jgi:ATP-binding cassette, subfamily B, bacterial PglK
LDITLVKKIWKLISRTERKSAYFLIFLIIFGMFAETLSIGLIVPVLTLITQPDIAINHPVIHSWMITLFGTQPHYIYVVYILLVFMILQVTKSIFIAYLNFKQAQFAFNAQKHLSYTMFELYLNQPITFHLRRNSSQMVNNVITEVVIFRDTLLLLLMLIAEFLVVLGMVLLALIIEPVGTIVVFSFVLAIGLIYQLITKDFISRQAYIRQHNDALRILHLQQGLGSIKEIKVLGCENEFLNRFQMPNLKTANAGANYSAMANIPRLWMETLCILTLSTVLIYLTIAKEDLAYAIPSMGLFLAMIFRLLPSSNRILGAIQGLRYGLPAINRLSLEISSNQVIKNVENKPKVYNALWNEIKFDNVCFTYPGDKKEIIKNLSINVKKGEAVGVYGISGSGKSTILDLLIGLLKPTSGIITVGGENIQMNVRSWQDNISYIPQSIFLIDDSISKNIAFGVDGNCINENRVLSCIRDAQLEDWVNSLSNKHNTVVGEDGSLMSGGQRQRIGIARALYKDNPILILDEATSSLDIKAEQEVMDVIKRLKGNKTIIIVAHRLSNLSICDRLFKFDSSGLHEVQSIDN